MAKTSALDRAIANIDAKIATLESARLHLLSIKSETAVKATAKLRTVRVKLPKPGELRDRAILGGEPSL